MFHKLRAYLERQAHLTEEEYALLETLFLPTTFKKGEFLLREGEIAKSVPLLPAVVYAAIPWMTKAKNTFFNFLLKTGGAATWIVTATVRHRRIL